LTLRLFFRSSLRLRELYLVPHEPSPVLIVIFVIGMGSVIGVLGGHVRWENGDGTLNRGDRGPDGHGSRPVRLAQVRVYSIEFIVLWLIRCICQPYKMLNGLINVLCEVRVHLWLGCVVVKTKMTDGIVVGGLLYEVDPLGKACDVRLDVFEAAFIGSEAMLVEFGS
jgi:hypothetical protein